MLCVLGACRPEYVRIQRQPMLRYRATTNRFCML
jgi:hypothetical protein